MKVRIGFGLGTLGATQDGASFGALVETLEGLRFDSLWLSERATGPTLDPLVALAVAAGRTKKLKLGTSVQVLPGRNPVLLAKEWASLDVLSKGRTLPAFGLGVAHPVEQQAFGVAREQRAGIFDEALPLVRRFWTEDAVTHHGEHFSFDGITVLPKPVQQPPDVWLGGIAPSELRRVGRLGDGWLPSFCTPDDVRTGRKTIEEVAGAHDRAIDPEHFGALVAYSHGPLLDLVLAALKQRRPDVDPAGLIPVGLPAVRDRLEAFVEAGASKFVVVPLADPEDWAEELGEVAAALKPLEN